MTRLLPALALLASITLSGCVTSGGGSSVNLAAKRKEMSDAIAQEPPNAYWVGRRYYKVDYKFWGYVRRSHQPWSTARMVMLNENQKLAPDREQGHIGSDNNYEYKLLGDFSGQSVYEPASNRVYPEFVLKGTELLTTTPGPIYRDPRATDPTYRIIPQPY